MNVATSNAAKRVMVLYTGGTIGMQASANGLAPASGFEARMGEYLASQPDLNVVQWCFREMSPLISVWFGLGDVAKVVFLSLAALMAS